MTTRDWAKPRTGITKLEAAFGPESLCDWLPAWDEIPEEFKRDRNPFARVASTWFFQGLPDGALIPKPGINHTMALAHLSAVLRSFEPKHEHKEAGVAYLMSLWFEEPKL